VCQSASGAPRCESKARTASKVTRLAVNSNPPIFNSLVIFDRTAWLLFAV